MRKNVSCEYDRVNGWNSTLQAAWYIRHVFIKGFYKKLKNVSCEYDGVNGWNSTLQAAWYIRHVRIMCFLWTKRTIWLLILSFTPNIVRACSMFYPYEGYRLGRWLPWMLPGSTGRFSITISVHWKRPLWIQPCEWLKKRICDQIDNWKHLCFFRAFPDHFGCHYSAVKN